MSGPTALQALAAKTQGVLTPANVLDGAAFLGAAWAGPRFDTWPGVLAAMASYGADAVDGTLARATRTTSHVGELLDHVGDKPKVGLAIYYIWRKRLADRRLLAAVAAYNTVTASITVYDRLTNGSPRVEVTREGKRAMFSTVTGVGLQMLAVQIGRTLPRAGRAIRRVGAVMVCAGLVRYGFPTIQQYWRLATDPSEPSAVATLSTPGSAR